MTPRRGQEFSIEGGACSGNAIRRPKGYEFRYWIFDALNIVELNLGGSLTCASPSDCALLPMHCVVEVVGGRIVLILATLKHT